MWPKSNLACTAFPINLQYNQIDVNVLVPLILDIHNLVSSVKENKKTNKANSIQTNISDLVLYLTA